MQKGTFLYKAMHRYRIKNLIINIILTILLIAFIILKLPYIKTEIKGATPLDTDRFLKETSTFVIDKPVTLDRHEEKNPSAVCSKRTSYWQDEKYLFDIKIDSPKKTGIVFKTKMNIGQKEPVEYDTAEVYLAKIGKRDIAIIGQPQLVPKNTVTGFLVEKSRPVISELSKETENGRIFELCDYFIDARDLEMDVSGADWFITKAGILLLLFLYIKLLIYFIKPALTPTYRQLRRYGDIEDISDEVNRQIEFKDNITENKKLITKDFIIYDSSFKKVVNRNHMAKH